MSGDHLSIHIEKRFPGFDLRVNEQLALDGVTALFGPSGSGKSTLLRLLMGLEQVDEGTISLGDIQLVDKAKRLSLPVHKRDLGMVFQDGRLLAHLDVANNLRFAETRARTSKPYLTLPQAIDTFDLSELLNRQPETLSGGERQRVALAQAILAAPRLLMLDEPLTGLDVDRKQVILPYLARLKQSLALPILYVSHDVSEVAELADHALILSAGDVLAHGPAVLTLNAHGFGKTANQYDGAIIEGRVEAVDTRLHLMKIALTNNLMILPQQSGARPGQHIRTIIRASDVALSLTKPDGISIQNILNGQIGTITPFAETALVSVTVSLGDQTLHANITRASLESMALVPGMDIFALVKTATLLPAGTNSL